MSENTKIEWCDHTFNPWIGCTKVGPGCDNCYAEADFGHRRKVVRWGAGQPRKRTAPSTWAQPIRWNDHEFVACEACGHRGTPVRVGTNGNGRACAKCDLECVREVRPRVFCASLADVFDNEVPAHWRIDLLELIAKTPNIDWLLLTKRIGNAHGMLNEAARNLVGGLPTWWSADAWPNVWLGATIVNQEEADRDIPKLLAVPAAKRFLSMEPLLGPVNLERPMPGPDMDQGGGQMICQPWLIQSGIDWVIVGGESGPGARPMHPDWARSLRDQCQAAGVPFLFKQWGEWGPTWFEAHNYLGPLAPSDPSGVSAIAGTRLIVGRYEDGRAYEDIWPVIKAGKKAAGRRLDGITHDGVPT